VTEQLTIGGGLLPDAFRDAWRACEQGRGLPPARFARAEVLHDRWGRWWVAVEIDGRRWSLMGRPDLEAAARDLFRQVHGGRCE